MEKLDRNTTSFEAKECKKSPCGEHHTNGGYTKTDKHTKKKFYLCDYCKKPMHQVPGTDLPDVSRL